MILEALQTKESTGTFAQLVWSHLFCAHETQKGVYGLRFMRTEIRGESGNDTGVVGEVDMLYLRYPCWEGSDVS